MRISPKIVRTITLVAAGAALVAVVPAQANVGVGTDPNVNMSRPTRNVLPFVQIAMGTRNLDLRTRNVLVTCQGVSVGDAIATAITDCRIEVNGITVVRRPLAGPGPLMASTVVSQTVALGATVRGCVDVRGTFSDASTIDSRTCVNGGVAAE